MGYVLFALSAVGTIAAIILAANGLLIEGAGVYAATFFALSIILCVAGRVSPLVLLGIKAPTKADIAG